MSKDCVVIFVDEPEKCEYCGDGKLTGLPGDACENCMNTGLRWPLGSDDIEDQAARVFMRFTEPPSDDFLNRLAIANPGKRVYCLTGASSWHSHDQ